MKIDIDLIIDKVEQLIVTPPERGLNNNELICWLEGYTQCYNDHIELLRGIKKEYGNSAS